MADDNEKRGGVESGSEDKLPAFGLAEEVFGTGMAGGNADAESAPAAKRSGYESTVSELVNDLTDEFYSKYVTFWLGNEEYGLPISEVQEINRVGEITRVPNSPIHVLGVINLRGRIVPVIELRKRLHLGEAELSKNSRVIVVEYGPKVLGLLVDRVAQVLNISSSQIDDAPEEVVQVSENFIEGVGKIDDRMIILLDLDKIVNHDGK